MKHMVCTTFTTVQAGQKPELLLGADNLAMRSSRKAHTEPRN